MTRKCIRLAAGLFAIMAFFTASANGQVKTVRIGMAKSFIAQQPKSFVDIASDEFKEVMVKATGLTGEFDTKDTAFQIADKMEKKKLDFGLFHAHELGWVREKYKDILPLVVTNTGDKASRAYLVVGKKEAVKSIADLQGKTLDLAKDASELSRVFIDKISNESAKKNADKFFGAIKEGKNQTDALDAVAKGDAQATVVDSYALDFYKDIKAPVFEKHLIVLRESEPFPPAVIVYRKDGVDAATVKQFRDGLLTAHKLPEGRAFMKTWNFKNFTPVPANYDKSVAEIMKAYPSPTSR